MHETEEPENLFEDQDPSRGSSYYYRGSKPPADPAQTPYIDPDQLQSLAGGHFGITNLLLSSFALGLILWFSVPWLVTIDLPVDVTALFVIAAVAAGCFFIPTVKNIGIGLQWSSWMTIPVSIILGLNLLVCGGALGFMFYQQMTSNALRKYGLKVHSLGIRRRDVADKVEEMRRRKLSGEPEQ